MKIVMLFLFFFAATFAYAADLSTEAQTKEVCSSAVKKFAAGEIDAAFESMLPYWPLPKEELMNLGYQSKSKLGMVEDRFGSALGTEFVRTVAVGESLISHVFLIKREKHALRFSCIFYKPKDKWLVNSMNWDDSLKSLFEASN